MTQVQPSHIGEEYYTIEEVATMLRVSVRTVYRWIKDEKIEVMQIMKGGAYRVRATELERFASKSLI